MKAHIFDKIITELLTANMHIACKCVWMYMAAGSFITDFQSFCRRCTNVSVNCWVCHVERTRFGANYSGGQRNEPVSGSTLGLNRRRLARRAGDACTVNQLSKYLPALHRNTPIHSLHRGRGALLPVTLPRTLFHSSLSDRESLSGMSVKYVHSMPFLSHSLLQLIEGSL